MSAPVCAVCAYRFGAGVVFWSVMGLCPQTTRAVRWPARRRTYAPCPECGTRATTTQVAPGVVEVLG